MTISKEEKLELEKLRKSVESFEISIKADYEELKVSYGGTRKPKKTTVKFSSVPELKAFLSGMEATVNVLVSDAE